MWPYIGSHSQDYISMLISYNVELGMMIFHELQIIIMGRDTGLGIN